MQRRGQQAEDPPFAPRGGDIGAALGMVGLVEAEGPATVLIPVAAIAGHLPHVVGGREPVGLREIDLADPRRIGRHGNVVVGNSLGGPHGADGVLARPYDFHQPDFLGIGDGQGFAAVAPAMFLEEVAGEADRLAGCARAFEHEAGERVAVDQPFHADELRAAAKGRLADRHLPLVHGGVFRGQVAEGLRRLGDAARRRTIVTRHGAAVVVVPLAQLPLGTARMLRLRNNDNVRAIAMPVTGVRGHHGAVGRGLPADHDRSAGPSIAGEKHANNCSRRHDEKAK